MSQNVSLLDDALALAEDLRPTLFHLHRQLRHESTGHGISPLQNLLLSMIIKHPGIGVGDLARLEKLRGPTVSGHVKALEADGLLARTEPRPDDRRRVGLVATEKGQSVAAAMRRRRTDWLARELARLSPEARQAIRNALGPLGQLGR
jgi:DNA-binding MarR family transcriptional regulator